MPTVNNVTRFLDARKVSYTAFETPPEKLGALDVAHLLNVEPDSVFKTIVVTRAKPLNPLLVVAVVSLASYERVAGLLEWKAMKNTTMLC